ncbi:MAG: ABC-three component system middle component 6 [Saprospiraceae bacterium]
MILPIDMNPNQSLYVIGSQIIKELSINPMGILDVNILYGKVNESNGKKLTFNQYLYGLDWLFLLGLIQMHNKTQIEKCF